MPGKRILLFRSKNDDVSNEDIYEKLLNAHDYHVKTISPIQFHFIHQDLLTTKLQSDDYYGLIFTSKRAVEAVQQVLSENDRQRWKKIYVDGPATGVLVRETFGPIVNILGAECGGGESLAEFIIQDVRDISNDVRFLFPCATARLDLLPKRLSHEGIHFDEINVYETIPSNTLDEELQEYLQTNGKPDVLGFFSPSGFDSVYKSSQRIDFDLTNNQITLISLGKTTSASIRKTLDSTIFNERTCLKPTPEEFLRVIQDIQ